MTSWTPLVYCYNYIVLYGHPGFCFVLGKPHSLEQELLASLLTILNSQTSAIFLKAKHVLLIDFISTPPLVYFNLFALCTIHFCLLCLTKVSVIWCVFFLE